MRIRKRQVPFPLSSLSPVPLSDPLWCNSSSTIPHNQKPHTHLKISPHKVIDMPTLVLSSLISPINVSHRSVEEATAWISLMMLLVGHTTRSCFCKEKMREAEWKRRVMIPGWEAFWVQKLLLGFFQNQVLPVKAETQLSPQVSSRLPSSSSLLAPRISVYIHHTAIPDGAFA
ncbi:uncharacterized protein LOC126699162 [Quercus robur]|uniref:uncharacterized protein LOC126699162 n=1 Tax=Quercus robur TaxID=38942 RepID=UPI0021623739|nr:uncharacterized protein LOC126699162 [Quercus robur]XP_050252791.1 uncharacterized protein LOC126699162 [Quercus robur]